MADNLEKGLRKSRNSFFGKIKNLLIEGGQDESVYEEIEELLISADTGMETSLKIIEELKRRKVPSGNRTEVLKEIIAEILAGAGSSDIRTHESEKPLIYLFAGVNGTGKTTTIGKLAYKLTKNGRKVIVAAADTFRAAAAEQLTEWAERAGCDIIRQDDGADPAAVVFDACNAAKARGADVLLIDTAGRLHTKGNLIEELKKIDRVIKKHGDRYPDESFIVIDANTGQNGLNQVKVFNEALGLSGIVLTKIDGTSRGGLVISAVDKYRIPVKLLGCGEKIEDLHSFDPVSFANILFEPGKEKDSIEYFSKADKKIEMEEKKARLNKEREEKIRRKFEEKRRKKEKKKDLQNKPTKSTAKPALIFVSVVLAVLIALFGFFKYTDTVIEKAAAQADSAVSKGRFSKFRENKNFIEEKNALFLYRFFGNDNDSLLLYYDSLQRRHSLLKSQLFETEEKARKLLSENDTAAALELIDKKIPDDYNWKDLNEMKNSIEKVSGNGNDEKTASGNGEKK